MTSDDIIEAIVDAIVRYKAVDIIYVHPVETEGPVAAIVMKDTPAWDAMLKAYPDLELEPHDHIEPGMW